MSDTSYRIKRITFFGRDVPIFMQNLNGPCPLLALANILSLRNQLTSIPRDAPDISQQRLISLVAEVLLEQNRLAGLPEHVAVNLQQNLNDVLEVFEKLAVGLDVNLRFHSIFGFEPTKEVLLFDLLDVSLVHGWLVDPQDEPTAAALGDKSYNELVELLVTALGDAELERLSSTSSSMPARSATQSRRSSLAGGSFAQQSAALQRASPSADVGASEAATGSVEPATGSVEPATGAAEPTAAADVPAAAAAAAPDEVDQAQLGQAMAAAQPESAAASAPAGTAVITQASAVHATAVQEAAVQAIREAPPAPSAAAAAAAPPPPSAAASAADVDAGAVHHLVQAMISKIILQDQPQAEQDQQQQVEQVEQQQVPAASALPQEASPAPDASAAQQPLATHTEDIPAPSAAPSPPPPAPEPSDDPASSEPPPGPAPSSAPGASKPAASAPQLATALLIRDFLDATCNQLTVYGLASLASDLKERQLSVLFRNNHFNTLFKYEGQLYLLVTDQGYLHEQDVVWERLDAVDGNTQMCNAEFHEFAPHADALPEGMYADEDAATAAAVAAAAAASEREAAAGGGAPQGMTDEDYALALHLQEQEAYEQERRRREQQRAWEQEQARQQQAAAQQARQQEQAAQQARQPRRSGQSGAQGGDGEKGTFDELKEKCSIM